MPEQQIVKLGNGNVSISGAVQVPDMDTVNGLLFLEPDLGAGEIGAPVPTRPEGKPIWTAEVNGVVLEFSNIASVDVLIGQLQEMRRQYAAAMEDTDTRRDYYNKGQAANTARVN